MEEQVINALLRALREDPSVSVRREAVLALGRTEQVSVLEPLIEVLGHEHSAVRRAAALALGMLRDSRSREPLLEALANDPVVWREAAAALGMLPRSPHDVDRLAELIASAERIEVRQGAALALGMISQSIDAVQQEFLNAYEDEAGKVHVLR